MLVQGSLQSPLLSPVLAALSACLQTASPGRALILALHRSPRQWTQVLRRLGLSELRLAADKRLAIVDLWEHLDFEPAEKTNGGQGDAAPCSTEFRCVPKLVDILAQFVRQTPRDSDAADLWPTLVVWDDLTARQGGRVRVQCAALCAFLSGDAEQMVSVALPAIALHSEFPAHPLTILCFPQILSNLVNDSTEWRAMLRILRALPGVDEVRAAVRVLAVA